MDSETVKPLAELAWEEVARLYRAVERELAIQLPLIELATVQLPLVEAQSAPAPDSEVRSE